MLLPYPSSLGNPWADPGAVFQTHMKKPPLCFQINYIYRDSDSSPCHHYTIHHHTQKILFTGNHKFITGQEEGSISGKCSLLFKRWLPALNNNTTKQWGQGEEQSRNRFQLSHSAGATSLPKSSLSYSYNQMVLHLSQQWWGNVRIVIYIIIFY